MSSVWSSPAYDIAVALTAGVGTALCVGARRARRRSAERPPRWPLWAAKAVALVLLADAVVYTTTSVAGKVFSVGLLPLQLCDLLIVVAAAALWWRHPLLVEVTYFWGLAGTLQAVLTPDLGARFPQVQFFEFVVGHLAIVLAAAYLVVGLGVRPRRGAVLRTFGVSVAYTGAIGLVDAVTGANFMYLRHAPVSWSLLDVLGPWPWYVVSAAALALAIFTVLDLPFALQRRRSGRHGGQAAC